MARTADHALGATQGRLVRAEYAFFTADPVGPAWPVRSLCTWDAFAISSPVSRWALHDYDG